MKIGFFSLASIAHGGGYEKQIVQMAHTLEKRGHVLSIISLSPQATRYLGIFLSYIYLRPRFTFPEIAKTQQKTLGENITVIEFTSLWELRKIFYSFDVIYGKNEILDSIVLLFAKNKKTPPLVCGMHTVLEYAKCRTIFMTIHNLIYRNFFYFFLLQIYSAFHCLNTTDKNMLVNKMKNKKIFYIPNFLRKRTSFKKSFDKNVFNVLYVGRLTEEKGIVFLLEIIRSIQELPESKNIEFVICGSGSFQKEIVALSKQYSNVKYRGHISQDEVDILYKKSDVLVTFSLGETFGLACLEALQYGTPVVGFDIPGIHDFIKENKNGFLIPVGDKEKFIQSLISLQNYKFNNKIFYAFLRKTSIRMVVKHFSEQVIGPKVEEMFAIIANV